MANTRFTISTDPAIQAGIKAHAEAAGLDVTAVAARHTLEGLVDALVVALNAGKPAGGR